MWDWLQSVVYLSGSVIVLLWVAVPVLVLAVISIVYFAVEEFDRYFGGRGAV